MEINSKVTLVDGKPKFKTANSSEVRYRAVITVDFYFEDRGDSSANERMAYTKAYELIQDIPNAHLESIGVGYGN